MSAARREPRPPGGLALPEAAGYDGRRGRDMADTLWTIGHSTHALDHFLGLLGGESIELVADVRRFPGSRRHPQFDREALEAGLSSQSVGYRHFPELGGRRGRPRAGSPNTGWRVEAFNAYADHM